MQAAIIVTLTTIIYVFVPINYSCTPVTALFEHSGAGSTINITNVYTVRCSVVRRTGHSSSRGTRPGCLSVGPSARLFLGAFPAAWSARGDVSTLLVANGCAPLHTLCANVLTQPFTLSVSLIVSHTLSVLLCLCLCH